MGTPDPQLGPRSARFSAFEVNFVSRELFKHGTRVRLQKQPYEILCMLLEKPGEIVSREALRERLWPGHTFVEYEDSLNTAVRKLRSALSDSSETPRYIETIAGRGYRFIAPLIGGVAPQGDPSFSDQRIGQRIGDFRVLQLLGGGGMGVVYKAEDLKLGRKVAIKFLPKELAGDETALERLRREARAISQLEHPNICPIYQLVEQERDSFLVIQLLEGQTLREWIESFVDDGQAKHLSKAIGLALEIVEGLDAAHQKGILHRDIKPANIMVTKRGQAKILDFGVAKFLERTDVAEANQEYIRPEEFPANPNLTRTGNTMGTPSYLSPEQIRREALDARSDLFSFGALLYEMTTGQKAFNGESAAAIRQAILNDPVVPARRHNPEIPEELEFIIAKALEKDRNRRYSSSSAIGADLRLLQEKFFSGAVTTQSSVSDPASVRTASGNDGKTRHIWQEAWVGSIVAFTVIIIAAGFFYRAKIVPTTPTNTASHRQLTFSGTAYSPALSPDGTLVAFVTHNPGEEQKLMMQGPDGPAIEMSHGPELSNPRWSPSGSGLLFQSKPADGPPKIYYFVFPRQNEEATFADMGGNASCWSPDGAEIVRSIDSLKMLQFINVKSGITRRIQLPRYSYLTDLDSSPKSGLLVVAARVDDKVRIWTTRPDGSEIRLIMDESEDIGSVRWAGDWIYYLKPRGDTSDLMRIPPTENAKPNLVATGLQAGDYFTITSDGNRVGYTRVEHSANLWQVAFSSDGVGSAKVSRLTSGTGGYRQPSFSPDGSWIAYQFGTGSAGTNIYKMRPSGEEKTQLTFGRALNESPAWSPDGHSLAFISDQSGSHRVWTVEASGQSAKALDWTNANETNDYVTWYPSGNIVYQQPGIQNYLQVTDSTGNQKSILTQNTNAWLFTKPTFSPDGAVMAVLWNRLGLALWTISLSPYSEKRVAQGEIYPFGWSANGKALYGLRGPNGGQEIVRIDLEKPDKPFLLARLPGTASGATLSLNEKQAIVSIEEEKSDVWLIDHLDKARVR